MDKKILLNISIFLYIGLLFVSIFLINLKRQSLYYPLYEQDQARDTYISYFINRHGITPDYAPWCGNCRKEYHLTNSKIYYYLLAPFSFTRDGSSVLYFCSFWFSLTVPLVFVLTMLLSNKYAGVLAATIMFQSDFMKYIDWMPYQPFFTPTMSVIFLIFLVLSKKNNSVFYFFLSTVALFLGIQFHLSFILLIILYLWVFLELLKKSKFKIKILLSLISLIFIIFFLFFNTNFIVDSQNNFMPMQVASAITFKKILILSLINDYKSIFKENWFFLYIFLLFLVLNLKNIKYKFLFLIFIFYPIIALGSHIDNIFTAPCVPFLVVLFSSIVLRSQNRILFILILFLVVFLDLNKFSIQNIRISNPVDGSQKVLSEMNKILDPFLRNNSNYCVYICDDDDIPWPANGFNFYRNQIGKSEKNYFDLACDYGNDKVVNNQNISLYYYVNEKDCKFVFKNEEISKPYSFKKIFSENNRAVYLMNKK